MFRFVNHWWEYVSAEFSTSRRTRPSSNSNSQLHVETLEVRLNLSGSVGEGFYDFENLAVDTRAPDPIVYNPNSSAADTSETVDFRFNLLPFVNPQGQTRNPVNDTPRVFNPSGINVGGKMLRFSSRAVEIPNGDPRIFDGSITFDTEVHFVEFKIRSAGNLDDIGISLPNSSASIVISDLNEGNFNTKLVRIGNRLSGPGFDDIQFNFVNGQIDSPDVPRFTWTSFVCFDDPLRVLRFPTALLPKVLP